MRQRLVSLVFLAILAACSAALPTPDPGPPTREDAPPAPPSASEPALSVAPLASSSVPPASASAVASAEPSRSTTGLPAVDRALERTGAACPAGMILIDGDYCTKAEQKCLKHWYDKSNKKEICEQYDTAVKCIGSKVKKRFCIDTFSWPNIKGERPEIMNTFYQAMVKCAAVGKRMCTETEWSFACEGPDMKPFPYGYVRDTTKCNGDHRWDNPQVGLSNNLDPTELTRLWKGVPNGAQPECISDYGVPDLPGNTDDVVANDSYKKGGIYANYDSVHTGGPWYKGVRNACRPKVYSHSEGFAYYFLSFRCCAEADGKPTDPRTPRMVESNASFSKVEMYARFTVDEMKKKLDLKAKGQCTCGEGDSLCKIMCGLALPSTAVDVDLKGPR